MRPRARMFRVVAIGEDAWEAMEAPELHGKLHRRPLFLRFEAPDGTDPTVHASGLMETRDERITNPDGPCGVIQIGKLSWLFFGWYRTDAVPIEDRKERISLSDLTDLENDDDETVPGPDPEQEDEDQAGDP